MTMTLMQKVIKWLETQYVDYVYNRGDFIVIQNEEQEICDWTLDVDQPSMEFFRNYE